MTRSTSKNTMSTRGRGQLLAWLDKKLDEDGLPLELLREFLGRPYLVLSPLPPLEIAERVATFRHGPEYVKLMTRIALSTHNPDHALEAEKEYLRVKFYYSRQERRLMLKDVVAAWSSTGDLDKALNWAKEIKDPNLLCHGLWLCYQLHRQAEVRQALRQAIAHHPEPLRRRRLLGRDDLPDAVDEDLRASAR